MDDGFESIGSFGVNADPWDRYIAHQAAKGNYPPQPKETVDDQDEEKGDNNG